MLVFVRLISGGSCFFPWLLFLTLSPRSASGACFREQLEYLKLLAKCNFLFCQSHWRLEIRNTFNAYVIQISLCSNNFSLSLASLVAGGGVSALAAANSIAF